MRDNRRPSETTATSPPPDSGRGTQDRRVHVEPDTPFIENTTPVEDMQGVFGMHFL